MPQDSLPISGIQPELIAQIRQRLAEADSQEKRLASREARIQAAKARNAAWRAKLLSALEVLGALECEPEDDPAASSPRVSDSIERILLDGATSPESAITAEEVQERLKSAGADIADLRTVRSHLSGGRARGWKRTPERPTRWYFPRPTALPGQEVGVA